MSKNVTVQAPYDLSVIRELPLQSAEDLETMLSEAHDAFRERRWLQPHERIELLTAIAGLMEKHQDELVQISAQEGGKPHADTLVEVKRAIQGVHVAIHSMHEQGGTEIPMGLTPASTITGATPPCSSAARVPGANCEFSFQPTPGEPMKDK